MDVIKKTGETKAWNEKKVMKSKCNAIKCYAVLCERPLVPRAPLALFPSHALCCPVSLARPPYCQ
jgi:hypothetical protein